MEILFKSFYEHIRDKKYQGKGFATLFVEATKSKLSREDTNRRRILFLFNSFVSISGGDIRFIEVYKRVKDFDSIIVTPLIGKEVCEINKLKARYRITTKERHPNNIFFVYFMRTVRALSLRIRVQNGDILYSTSDFLPDTFPSFVYKLMNKRAKWVAAFHLIAPNPFYGPDQYYRSNKKMRIPTINAVLNKTAQLFSVMLIKWKADRILVVNSEISNYLTTNFNVNKRRITIVDNGVDLDKIITTKQPKDDKKYDACFIGRFHQQKGIFDLINIWGLVCKEKPAAKLALIGNGCEKTRRKIETEITARRLAGNVEVLGFLDEENKILALKSSKIFLFPSTYESWGIVAAEAMACGLPVVAWDLPVYKEIFPKGLVEIPQGNTFEFASRVLELLENKGLLNKIQNQAIETASKYDWNRVAKKELEILDSL
jgi:glycosyltransferase involved in cell wall biosynthesis